jgi:hypothetical protein
VFEHIVAQPFWIKAWIFWMIFINGASLLFVGRSEGRWVLAAWLLSVVTMHQLYLHFGYTRILGLSHLLWWTPLVVYLFRKRASFGEGGFGGWARLLVLTNAASLAVDFVDVARFLLGDRAPV